MPKSLLKRKRSNLLHQKNQNKKINVIKKNNNAINLDSISNNINSTINTNTNTMTETNNVSFEKQKDKNFKKIEAKKGCYHKKQKTMSEISFNEIVKVQVLNDEFNHTISNKSGNNYKISVKKNEERNVIKKSPHNKTNFKNNGKKNF